MRGIGISSENLGKLFSNTYFTTNGTPNESGIGLGLLLCKQFLIKNGSSISVESDLVKGSKFVFTFPQNLRFCLRLFALPLFKTVASPHLNHFSIFLCYTAIEVF
ncbi:MAG: ATP-binding protein [Ferruginibacter sp.]